MDCREYLNQFEKEVIVRGFHQKTFGLVKETTVPLRRGKLANTDLGWFIGDEFYFDKFLAINYYGYFKLSSGIYRVVEESEKIFPGIRSVRAPVVHFNSIKIEHVKQLAAAMMQNFPDFKKLIVDLRWHG